MLLNAGGWWPSDRQSHRQKVSELHSGNALYAAKHEGHFPFRAQWCHAPDVGGTTLFHRWILRLAAKGPLYVEHVNGIPLDCRQVNLRVAASLHANNQHTHRFGRAVASRTLGMAEAAVDRALQDQLAYFSVAEACPPLPDCEFCFKTTPVCLARAPGG